MANSITNTQARESILRSIRSNLASSVEHDKHEAISHETLPAVSLSGPAENGNAISVVELFKQSLEGVNGHCIIVRNELEIVRALTKIITDVQTTNFKVRRIAISNAPGLERLVNLIAVEVDEVCVTPSASDLFNVDVGITTAQAAIAETGTLVLDSSSERNRLTSLVPPIHIAIVDASQIRQTLGETLSALRSDTEVSPIVTFITGPSRTGDIEMILTIGVHGPQELYVIVNEGPSLVTNSI